uniref:Membrane insertase YidC/Oxa/ALB C-terminal domain-containing protein n=1 Tax=Marmota marmota marmota TaxID=9994 RepID=A0A8C5ZKJ1_MARMA
SSVPQYHRSSQWPWKPLREGLQVLSHPGCRQPHYVLVIISSHRCLSTSAISFAEAQVQVPPVVPATPSPTAVPEVASGRTTDIIHAVAEQRFAELGLGPYTPVGLTQNLLEFMHVNLGLPWWGAIAACTVLARCLVFPLIVKGQREVAKIHNHLPEIQKFSTRIREAKLAGDNAEFYRASKEMTLYQKKQDIKFFKPLILPLTQALVFISFFIALREMANLPVLSMQTGGLWWFQDLTVSDPIYMLWIVVTATMWGVLELGADTGVQSSDLQWMRNVIRVSPWQSCPYHPLPLGSVHVLALLQYVFPGPSSLPPATVRTVLKIPQRVVHDPDKLPPREGFIKSFKQARGPLQQTFTHNPLLQHEKNHPPKTPSSSNTNNSNKPKSKQPWRDTLG